MVDSNKSANCTLLQWLQSIALKLQYCISKSFLLNSCRDEPLALCQWSKILRAVMVVKKEKNKMLHRGSQTIVILLASRGWQCFRFCQRWCRQKWKLAGKIWIQHWVYSYRRSTWNQHVGMKCLSYAWVTYVYVYFTCSMHLRLRIGTWSLCKAVPNTAESVCRRKFRLKAWRE